MRYSFVYFTLFCLLVTQTLVSCGNAKSKSRGQEPVEMEFFNTAPPKKSSTSSKKAKSPAMGKLEGDAAAKGLAIIQEAEKRDLGYKDFSADMEMILINKAGKEAKRVLQTQVLEIPEDGDMALILFDHPKDIQGTALLTHSHRNKADDQWVYLPDLKRVKRISSSNKSGPFMGSEFSYEDLSDQIVEKYSYELLEDSKVNGLECHVVAEFPKDPKSGYTKQVAYLDKVELRVQKVEYYDRKNSHQKTLIFSGYQQYLKKYWRPDTSFMENHQTGKSTRMTFSDYKFRVGLTKKDFDKNSLARAR